MTAPEHPAGYVDGRCVCGCVAYDHNVWRGWCVNCVDQHRYEPAGQEVPYGR